MGTCAPKFTIKGCISNSTKDRIIIVSISEHSNTETYPDRQKNLSHEIYERYRSQTAKERHEQRHKVSKYLINRAMPGMYIDEMMLSVLSEKHPLDVTILYEKEPNSKNFGILMHMDNQTNQANVRKCIWEDENNKIRVSNLAERPDPWRIVDRSVARNYPVGKACLVCHSQIRCKQDCQLWKICGGYVEN